MYSFAVRTTQRAEIIDITAEVTKIVSQHGMNSGLVMVFVPHTTAALTINEKADPSVKEDLLRGLAEIVPYQKGYYRHAEGNSDAHIKSSLLGCSVNLIIDQGRLVLGTWQAILFCEFDGPRKRKVFVQIV